MKKYIIVGSNNYWYATFNADNQNTIDKEIENVKENFPDGQPETLYVYEVTEIKRVDLLLIN